MGNKKLNVLQHPSPHTQKKHNHKYIYQNIRIRKSFCLCGASPWLFTNSEAFFWWLISIKVVELTEKIAFFTFRGETFLWVTLLDRADLTGVNTTFSLSLLVGYFLRGVDDVSEVNWAPPPAPPSAPPSASSPPSGPPSTSSLLWVLFFMLSKEKKRHSEKLIMITKICLTL